MITFVLIYNILIMKIVLIGAGNLATNLGKALLAAGHDILQVYSRTMESASRLAVQVGGSPTNDLNRLVYTADVYILSVKDNVLAELIPKVCKGREKSLVVHTAGSIPLDSFMGMTFHYGVFYPMQTFSKDREVDFQEIPVFIEYNDNFAKRKLELLAHSISNHVARLDSADRKYLHLAAVWACNFTNHCYDMASEILERHGMSFEIMLPLIDETTRKIHKISPQAAQTGPAVRYDENVIRSQSELLKDIPLAKDIYERMSVSIHRRNLESAQTDSRNV
ncbi:DUF2520 domain-containing protein [Prevotella dentasini JCM 15908]